MSLLRIAWRSIQQRSLSSLLTGFSMALGVALVIAVLVILNTLDDTFRQTSHGYNLIVGPKGGRLQLVLNSLFHLGTAEGTIPYTYYLQFRRGELAQARFRVSTHALVQTAPFWVRDTMLGACASSQRHLAELCATFAGTRDYSPLIEAAIPLCVGDNYEGYRVVGTIPDLFDIEYAEGKTYQFAQGRNIGRQWWQSRHFFEAVIGAEVARQTGLRVGDVFRPVHGVTEDNPEAHEHDPFTIVGVLAPTGTPNDRALFINMEGFFLLEGHSEEEHHHHHDHAGHVHPLPIPKRAVSAVLLRFSEDAIFHVPDIQAAVDKGRIAQAVAPAREVYVLMDTLVGGLRMILYFLTILILVVAGIGVMVSIYNTMNERRREIAIMRALGAGRRTVMVVIFLESILLSLGGGAVGMLLGHGLIGALSPLVADRTQVTIGLMQFVPYELVLIPGLIVLAALAGFLPALAAYRTDVSRALSASP
jgi:putative ABC transport system permease protein